MAFPTFLAEPVANLAVVGLVWAFSGDSGIAWGGLAGLVGLGMARDALQTRWLSGRFPAVRNLLFSPIKDILLLPLWFDAMVNSRVQWRGHRFRVGRLTRLREARVSRDVRRRVRRARKFRAQHGTAGSQGPGNAGRPGSARSGLTLALLVRAATESAGPQETLLNPAPQSPNHGGSFLSTPEAPWAKEVS